MVLKMKKMNFPLLIFCIALPLLVGFLSSYFVGDGFLTYQSVTQPPFSPPPFVFPIVWTVLYILMGISSYLILNSTKRDRAFAIKLYLANLFFNFFWSIIFFKNLDFLFAFVWLILLLFVVVWMVLEFKKISPGAALLNVPYILWLIYAAYLNFGVYVLN